MASGLDWKELDYDESLPMAPPETLRFVSQLSIHANAACLVIVPGAVFEEMMQHLKGDCTVERIGILVGRPYRRPCSEQLLACVDAALPVEDLDATRSRVSIGKRGWTETWKGLASSPEGQMIGWYHSHPDHGVFLSAVDRKTQALWFVQRWNVAIVVDPIRGEHQAFTGADGIATPLVLV